MSFKRVFCLLLILAACNRAPEIDPLSQKELDALKEKSGELLVVFASPTGSSDISKKITVSFNQPMSALESYQQTATDAPLELSPKVAGSFRWVGSKTLMFLPKEKLPFATEFNITVPKGTKSLLGKELAQDYSFSFTTNRPKVEKITPTHGSKNAEKNKVVYVYLNQPITVKQMQAALTVKTIDVHGVSAEWPVRVEEFSKEDLEEAKKYREDIFPGKLKILPVKPYPLLSRVVLQIDKTLSGSEGSLDMGTPFEAEFSIHGPFNINGLGCTQECYPGTLEIKLSHGMDEKAFGEALQFVPPLTEKPSCYYSSYESTMICSVTTLPATAYQVSVAAGIADDFGQKLDAEYKDVFKTGSFSPAFYFTGGHGVLEANGSREYYAYSMNISELNVRMAELKDTDLASRAFQYYNSERSQDPLEGLTISYENKQNLNLKKDFLNGLAIPLNSVEKGKFVLLDVTTPELYLYDSESKLNKATHHTALIQVTDLGVSAKWSPKNSLVWVTQLSDGKPVNGATVEIINKAGKVLWQGLSDEKGLSMMPGLSELNQLATASEENSDEEANEEVEDEPVYEDYGGYSSYDYLVLVKKDTDRAFLLSSWSDGFNVWDFGLAEDYASKAIQSRAFLFTERGVYRPGDKVFLKGIIREISSALPEIPKDAGQLKVYNAKGQVILDKEIKLNEFGSFTEELTLSADAPSGDYSITYSTKNEGVETRGAANFAVDYYRPQEFKINLENEKDDVVRGESLVGKISAEYLFGAPMKGRKVSWDVHYSNTDFDPPNQPEGYSWQRDYEEKPVTEWESSYNDVDQGDGLLDSKGQYKISIPVQKEEFLEPRRYTWEARVEDINHQNISERHYVMVHPAAIYLGVKQESYFAEAGKPIKGLIRAVDVNGTIQANTKIKAVWKKVEWNSVRKKGFRGVFTYASERTVRDISECNLSTGKADVVCEFTPKEPGIYLLAASGADKEGRKAYASSAVYASGSGYGNFKLEDTHQLTLKKDKDLYKPGDLARLLVQSPFDKGMALITQERSGIITKQVQEFTGYTPTIEIPIVKEQIPNTYVSVMLVNGRMAPVPVGNEDDRGKPSIHVGIINLPVESAELNLDVAVKADQEVYKPGEEATIQLKVKDAAGLPFKNAELTLMVVDQGVLRLTGFELPDPMDYFYSNQGLAVTSSDSRIYLIGKRALAAKMDSEAAGGGMEVNFRSKFVPTAYWNPSIVTDEKGEAKVQFKLPDNVTAFSVMAVALGNSSLFGSGESEFKTKKDLMIRPALPRFGRSGDKMIVGAVVHNESDKELSVELSAGFSGVKFDGKESQVLKLSPHSVKRVNYAVEVLAEKNIQARFIAKAAGIEDAVEWTIPVKYPQLLEHKVVSGITKDSSQEFVNKPQDVYAEVGGLDINLASTPLVGFGTEINQLRTYPFACLEQKISRVYPMILAENVVKNFALEDSSNWRDAVSDLIDNMGDLQLYDGGFKYWPDSWYSSYYLSAYVGEFLADSLNAGFKVDQYRIDKLVRFLQTELAKKRAPENELTLDEKFYMVRALSNLKQPVSTWIDTLYASRDQLAIASRAQLAMMLHQSNPLDARIPEEIRFLENAIVVSSDDVRVEEPGPENVYVNNSNRRTTALVLDALLTLNPAGQHLDNMIVWLMKSRNPNRWISTQESISVLRAVSHYHTVKEQVPPQFSALVQQGSKSVIQAAFTDYSLTKHRVSLPLEALADKETLTLSKKGEGTLFYTAELKYARKKHLFSVDQGMTISKRYEDSEGKEVTSFVAGDLYKVVVNLVFEFNSFNVAIEDPVPAGFEAVNPRLNGTSQQGMNLAKNKAIDENFPLEYLISYSEKQDDKIVAFADYIPKGSYEYIYYVRATTAGSYSVPASRVGEMYTPDNFGQSISGQIVINED